MQSGLVGVRLIEFGCGIAVRVVCVLLSRVRVCIGTAGNQIQKGKLKWLIVTYGDQEHTLKPIHR